jgi:hypothetical protein
MFKIINALFIFSLVLFLYIHIRFQLKKSNDLEIYEIDTIYKDKIEEVCDLRQPVIFNVNDICPKLIEQTNKDYLTQNYSVFNINIRNIKDIDNKDNDLYLPLSLSMSNKLFDEDKNATYITENNNDFLQETGTNKQIQYNDQIFRPPLVSNYNYDIIFSSNNASTLFKYDLNYRNYFIVTQGQVNVKLTPPKSSKYLHSIYDYENFEFFSPINPWEVQNNFLQDFEKIKCLEVTLEKGFCIHIPPYWFYSFKFNDTSSSILSLKYRTYMNNLTISPEIFLCVLQNQNIVRNYVKKINKPSNNQTNNPTNNQTNNEINNETNNETNNQTNNEINNQTNK